MTGLVSYRVGSYPPWNIDARNAGAMAETTAVLQRALPADPVVDALADRDTR